MSIYRLFVILGSWIAYTHCLPYIQLEQDESRDSIRTCEISGYVNRQTYQLHGNLYNCRSPAMNCTMDTHEYLTNTRNNIECRVPSNTWLFYDDKECAFRFYYRRTYCEDELLCYSIAITCHAVISPKLWFYLLVFVILLLSVLIPFGLVYLIYVKKYRIIWTSVKEKHRTYVDPAPEELELQELPTRL